MVGSSRASCAALVALALAAVGPARGQSFGPADATAPEQVSVTADRVPQPLGATGSDVTVIPGARIDEWGTNGITEALREVPGLSVTQTAGPSSTTQVRLRGEPPGEALVLLDGIPIGDVAGTDGSLDFGNLTALDIDRIEVVRGPQSALYGSDAMGGVIDVITREGTPGEPAHGTLFAEGGSFGTAEGRATIRGAAGNWTYAVGLGFQHTEGFPEFGYRVERPITLLDGVTKLPAAPAHEPSEKGSVSGRVGYRFSPEVNLETGWDVFGNQLAFANPDAAVPGDVFSPFNLSKTWIGSGFARLNAATADGVLATHLTVFGNLTELDVRETEACFDAAFNAFDCTNAYRGSRWGAEWQNELRLGALGELVFGARNLDERATTNESPNPEDGSFTPIRARQTTNSGFAEWRKTLGGQVDLTAGGRIDAVEGGATFETGRLTAAWRIPGTGTTLRGAVGDGAKVATLYQRFSPYGTPALQPERNVGGEIGVDQALLGGRLRGTATLFTTSETDLIDFGDVPSCGASQVALGGCYYNVGHARERGIEATLDATLVPHVLTAHAEYTYTDAENTQTDTALLRVPPQTGSVSVDWHATGRLEVEPRVLLVSPQHDDDAFTGATVVLPGYARFDMLAHYRLTHGLTAELRLQNLNDARIEEIYDYGQAGRSVYGGVTQTF